MKAPIFWNKKGIIPLVLTPFAWMYQKMGEWRWKMTRPMEMPIPVICIGNLVAGGAGKTPVALALGEILKAKKSSFHYLSRGYGGLPQEKPRLVMPHDDAAEMGDEPLLLSSVAPCWVCKDRKLSATAALRAGAEVIIMDDGYQNPSIHKSLNILVIDGAYGIGNGKVIPAGPLRETFESGSHRADAVIMIGKDSHHLRKKLPPSIPVFAGRIEPLRPLHQLSQPLYAFAGIGRPEKFFTMLNDAGVELAATQAFPDHHRYNKSELVALKSRAETANATLTCTAKDAIKLPDYFRDEVQIVEIAFHFEDLRGFTEWLEKAL